MKLFGKRKTDSDNNQISLSVQTNPEGKIDLLPNWPISEDKYRNEEMAKQFAFMVVNSYRKEIMPYIQTVISNHGVKIKSEKMANLILIYINSLLNPEVIDDNAPIVPPRQAFQVRGDN